MWDRDDEDLEEDLDWDEDVEDDEDSEHASFVCEDCYRWDESQEEDMDTGMHVCPMCGSVNVTQL